MSCFLGLPVYFDISRDSLKVGDEFNKESSTLDQTLGGVGDLQNGQVNTEEGVKSQVVIFKSSIQLIKSSILIFKSSIQLQSSLVYNYSQV